MSFALLEFISVSSWYTEIFVHHAALFDWASWRFDTCITREFSGSSILYLSIFNVSLQLQALFFCVNDGLGMDLLFRVQLCKLQNVAPYFLTSWFRSLTYCSADGILIFSGYCSSVVPVSDLCVGCVFPIYVYVMFWWGLLFYINVLVGWGLETQFTITKLFSFNLDLNNGYRENSPPLFYQHVYDQKDEIASL